MGCRFERGQTFKPKDASHFQITATLALHPRMNLEYPANGPWRFTVNRLVGDESEAVSDVTVTDGARTDRAITFFTVVHGKVTRMVEFWPEASAPAQNRGHLTESLE